MTNFLVGVFWGVLLTLIIQAIKTKFSIAAENAQPPCAPSPEPVPGEVWSMEYNGYIYYAHVKRVFTRRNCNLVEYQIQREDHPKPNGSWYSEMPIEQFHNVYGTKVQ